MMIQDVYKRLAKHLSSLGMGYPEAEELLEILRENFTPLEAEVALAIHTKVIPFEPDPIAKIASHIHLSKVDKEWCIGCGVCSIPCPSSAINLVRKSDVLPPKDFKELHQQILKERNA